MAKYKRINLGHKPEKIIEAVTEKREISYPTFYVHNKKLPLKGSDIGKTFDISAKIKFIGIREENREGSEEHSYDFEIREITFQEIEDV